MEGKKDWKAMAIKTRIPFSSKCKIAELGPNPCFLEESDCILYSNGLEYRIHIRSKIVLSRQFQFLKSN